MIARDMILPLPFGKPFGKPFGLPPGRPQFGLMPVSMAMPMKKGGKVKADKIAKAIRQVFADAKKKGEYVPPAVARAIGLKKAGYSKK